VVAGQEEHQQDSQTFEYLFNKGRKEDRAGQPGGGFGAGEQVDAQPEDCVNEESPAARNQRAP
jgi:hypothetical protein